MRVLITGGGGYIGSVLTEELLAVGHQVCVLDNFSHRQNSLGHLCHSKNLQIVRGDVRDERMIRNLMYVVDAVIPLAAVVGAPACDADRTAAESINLGAILTLLRFAAPSQQIVVPITNSGYGIGSSEECTEDSPLRPVSLYGRLKVEAEAAVLARENSISLRLATVFGMSPRMRIDLLVNDFVHRAVTDRALVLFEAHFRRNFVHVRDVAEAFMHCLAHFSEMRGRPYNVGLSDANLTKLQLCERIRNHAPKFTFLESAIGEDPDRRDYVVSNARIEETGWRARHSLDEGIVELVKGYRMIRNGRYGNV